GESIVTVAGIGLREWGGDRAKRKARPQGPGSFSISSAGEVRIPRRVINIWRPPGPPKFARRIIFIGGGFRLPPFTLESLL
ncbi:hypothetical protein, partial [Rhodoblastus sp.]|uniref:hypothetical protein n=1 Tax=Rhodoblastus sp. TaxID=1962975 RepID=UPI003F96E5DD